MKKSYKPTKPQLQTYCRLLAYAKPYSGRIAIALVFGLMFGGSIFGLLGAARGVLPSVFGTSPNDITETVESWVTAQYNSSADMSAWIATLLLLGAMVFFMFLRGVGGFFSKYLIEWVGQRVVMNLRNDTFSHISHLPLLYFTGSRTGELMSRTINDTQQVERGLTDVVCDLIQQPFALLCAAGALLYTDIRLALVSLIVFPVCVIPIGIFGKRVRRHARAGQERIADLSSLQQETILGAAIVKAFGTEDREKERFQKHSYDFFRRQIKITAAKASINPIMEFIASIGACLVLLYAKYKGLPFDSLLVFMGAMFFMYDPVKKLTRIHFSIQQCSAAAERIFDILDTPNTIQDQPNAVEFTGAIDEIEYRNIAFDYGKGSVLENISLTAHDGELIALVGGSGSGKTTMVNLLPRFFDPTGGEVLINGRNIKEYTIASLRRQIGIVTQETILFNDTVAANIAYGSPCASQEAIIQAAKKAHAHDFIMAMPNGYDTMIAERGIRLSGGQRQRLAIARALLCNPPILILDEATSALDTESERAVQEALNAAMEGRTVFAIAHRLSTIHRANQILVLDHGHIVERGTHADLLKTDSGIYNRLYQLQFQERPANDSDIIITA